MIKIIRKEFPYLNSNYGIKKIGLFGSFAKGRYRKDSDLDILVEFEKPIGFKFMEFAEYIEKIFDKKVEVLTYEGIKGIRQKQVAEDILRSVIYV